MDKSFQPYIKPEQTVAEFTLKAVLLGSMFGILFGCSTVYLALKAGLTVTASIPIAVIAITLGRALLKTTILENNIIQTAGSAGESIAGGVVFAVPGFLFLLPNAKIFGSDLAASCGRRPVLIRLAGNEGRYLGKHVQ